MKNNGERILEKWNRGWGISVWHIGLSEHTKEEEDGEFVRKEVEWIYVI